jgi:type I restriction enzyme M protein
VERNLDMLRPGGRMAIVLPQGRFNNSSEKQLRQYVAGRARLLAVVGLHPNSFKPHTGTKTSVLFVQKWNTDPTAGPLCPPVANYPIFFATQQKEGKNNSGEKLYWNAVPGLPPTPFADQALCDEYGHPIGWHDLFSVRTNDPALPRTPEGVAEAFQQFAAKEKLSFFR